MKKQFLLLILMLLPIVASAYDAKINGIYYNFSEDEAEVTYQKYEGYPIYEYISDYSGFVIIPSTVTYNDKTYSVSGIGNFAFDGCSSLTSVTIPNSMTIIGNRAFSGCSSLTSISIPNSVTSIGEAAFSDCSGLTSITIPNSVTIIGEYNQEIKGETNVEIIFVIA
ncbi:MAG: leucine-rich repeat domain-containing protein [Bacteroidaceae bacterium]|nr:leucine-rich repeat domain-containing protein [Bacteroidaceae bacterium]